MSELRDWAPYDATIRAMRVRDRATWGQISAQTGIPISSLRKHARQLELPTGYARRGGRGRIAWTDEKLAALAEMIRQRRPWDAIGPALGISRNAAIKQAKLLRMWEPRAPHNLGGEAALMATRQQYGPPAPAQRCSVDALPAGAYWPLICAGTCLADVPWGPLP